MDFKFGDFAQNCLNFHQIKKPHQSFPQYEMGASSHLPLLNLFFLKQDMRYQSHSSEELGQLILYYAPDIDNFLMHSTCIAVHMHMNTAGLYTQRQRKPTGG